MVVEIKATGAEQQLAATVRVLRLYGGREARKVFLNGLKKGARPVAAGIKRQMVEDLPAGGGLNKWYGGMRINPSVRSSGKNPGISLKGPRKGRGSRAGQASDTGQVRHPVHGDRRYWTNTDVESGFVERGGESEIPAATAAITGEFFEASAAIARYINAAG